MPKAKTLTLSKSTKSKQKSTSNSNVKDYFSVTSHSFSSVTTPQGTMNKELTFQNDNGKVKGKYIIITDGKQTLKKEFKSQRGLDAITKLTQK